MTKQDIINEVAAQENITKSMALTAFTAVFDAITDGLKAGYDVVIHGFGKFSVSQRAAREGRNPRDGSPVKIKATKVVRFQSHKRLKDEVNG